MKKKISATVLASVLVLGLTLYAMLGQYPVLRAWADTNWSSFTYILTGGITGRGDYNRFNDFGLNVKEYGAICDNTLHPLSERFATLAEARAVYPFVDDLTQQIDWAAIQQTINTVYNTVDFTYHSVWIPDGARCRTSLPIYLDAVQNLTGGNVAWNSAFTYTSLYDTANVAGVTYISIQAPNLNHDPTSSPTWWRPLRYDAGTGYGQGAISVFNGVPWVSQIVLGTITAGSSYTNGTYVQVPLTGGTGTGAQATVVVSGAAVTAVTVTVPGSGYVIGDSLSATAATIGGTGSGFAVAVAANTNHTPTLANLTYWKSASNLLTPYRNATYTLIGGQGLMSEFASGPAIYTTFNNAPALIVGPGNGNAVKGLVVQNEGFGGVAGWRCGMPQEGVGIIVSGGGFGASRTLLENVTVYAFYYGIQFGGEQVSLADSNTVRKSHISWACVGIGFMQSQNYINKLDDVNVNYSAIAVFVPTGTPVVVTGGNNSAVYGQANSFTWGSISAVTSTNDGGKYTLSFTATITNPDQYLDIGIFNNRAFSVQYPQLVGGEPTGVYNAFTFNTTGFGVVPAVMTAYNPTTNVGTFQVLQSWSYFYFAQVDPIATTDLGAEIQASTTVYANELTTVFWGNGFNVTGVHLETTAPNRLIYAQSGARQQNVIQSINGENVDPALPLYRPSNSPAAAQLGQYYTMTQFCYICIGSGGVTVENSQLGILIDPVMISFESSAGTSLKCVLTNNGDVRFNVRVAGGNGSYINNHSYSSINTNALGGCKFDISPFTAGLSQGEQGIAWTAGNGWGQTPTWGFRPVPGYMPCITPAQQTMLGRVVSGAASSGGLIRLTLNTTSGMTTGQSFSVRDVGGTTEANAVWTITVVDGTHIDLQSSTFVNAYTSGGTLLPTITYSGSSFSVGYPLIWGGQVNVLCDWTLGAQTRYFTASTHKFYSYFNNLTASITANLADWSYKGQSFKVAVNTKLFGLAFPGWGPQFNNGTDGNVQYITTGVFPGLGYITINCADDASCATKAVGSKTVTYTGTTIGQEAIGVQYPYLLKRDLDPAANDNTPMWLNMVA